MTESNLVHFLAKHQKNRSRQLTRAVLFLSMEMRGLEISPRPCFNINGFEASLKNMKSHMKSFVYDSINLAKLLAVSLALFSVT